MKILMTMSFMLILTLNAQSQKTVLKGRVTETDPSKSIAGALIYLENTSYATYTDAQGTFALEISEPAHFTLAVKFEGYQTFKTEIQTSPAETSELRIQLKEISSTLPEILVMTKGYNGVREIPGSVHYISPKELQKYNYTDIHRTLGMLPGIHIQEEDGFGLRPNIGLRGTGVERSSKITIMEDGVLISPAPYSEPAAYYFPTTGRMQAVEIIKGSSQIKYGPFTTGGAMNLVSTAIPDAFSGKINLWLGNHGSKNLHAYAGNAHKNISYVFETFQYNADGFKDLDGGGNTGFDKKDYLAKVSIHTNPGAAVPQSLSFKIDKTSETSNETYLGLTESDFNTTPYRRYYASQKDQMISEHNQIALIHTINPSAFLTIKSIAYHTDFSRNWYKLDKVKNITTGIKTGIADVLAKPDVYASEYDFISHTSTGLPAHSLILKANNRNYSARGIQSNVIYKFESGSLRHRIEFGLRLHEDEADRFQWEDEYDMNNGIMMLSFHGNPGSESNRVIESNALASFASYKLNWNKLTLSPGLRYEKIKSSQFEYGKNDAGRTGKDLKYTSNEESVFIPGIGVDYKFSKEMHGFFGLHKGFAPPGPQDETNPEISVNYELGFRFEKSFMNVNATIFFNDYSNLLGSDLSASGGGGTGDLFNGGSVESKGLEFECRYDLNRIFPHSKISLPLYISYTYMDAIFKNSFKSTFEDWGTVNQNDELPYTSKHQLSFQLSPEFQKFNFNITGKYLGKMRSKPGQNEISAAELIPSHFVVDISIKYIVNNNICLFANALNASDHVYLVSRRPAGLRPGLPRTCSVGMTARF
ncbi:MAG: TonB-dependent receptor [Saprospiraceae bacterium]|nr:TonB-dependent receptor [Saprospiraceae bacterium]